MKRSLFVALALTGMATLSGCIAVYTPAIGVLYSEVRHPGDAEGAIGAKEGRACAQSILGLVATGDASIQAAAAAGGIKNVTTVDHYTRNILGVLGEFCTIARGS
jgi:hypothetical protein